MKKRNLVVALFVIAAAFAATRPSSAETVNVAVAANFTAAAEEIAALFAEETGHEALLSFGSTGRLYAQILHGAPFSVFLAADQERPRLAVEAGLALADSRFTYALGALVLFSAEEDLVDDGGILERPDDFNRIAIANPASAPYGAAAVETLEALKLYDRLKDRIVRGENITQTFQFVATGNADIGFVALSQVAGKKGGSRWRVPQDLYSPIAQDAVLLTSGADNPAAFSFMAFLKSDAAHKIVQNHGYQIAP
ncbi:molybdate ABC transporter substrate-binding protein [Martelella lutilitoris]|uniref:Molybdate ABC transporter substrate-binding protein n=1 Tax=Martelella lutilitoris TaxID=2583532 RepID=A0A5C4JTP0_9HYPH|nr:molybdate ABC transporter substrate-binding protein [Martelella lutilitoris]TNB48738.1 molybdate ABC transporter substrate-binding protein [Martelella lutilitoris]